MSLRGDFSRGGMAHDTSFLCPSPPFHRPLRRSGWTPFRDGSVPVFLPRQSRTMAGIFRRQESQNITLKRIHYGCRYGSASNRGRGTNLSGSDDSSRAAITIVLGLIGRQQRLGEREPCREGSRAKSDDHDALRRVIGRSCDASVM